MAQLQRRALRTLLCGVILVPAVVAAGCGSSSSSDGGNAKPRRGFGNDEITGAQTLTTPGTYTYAVGDTTFLRVEVWGAGGGQGGIGRPGKGALVSGYLRVEQGQRLQMNVGGAGKNSGERRNFCGNRQSGIAGGAGGLNGGGAGGTSYYFNGKTGGGGGGGGASDIRRAPYELSDRVIVAGGGGGSSGSSESIWGPGIGSGGDAGYDAGSAGDRGFGHSRQNPVGGGGGGVSEGGKPGTGGDDRSGSAATAGELGIGGSGATYDGRCSEIIMNHGGGGGGGGAYGGGGGANAYYSGGGGGGGSSLGGKDYTAGANSGDGKVTITPTRVLTGPSATNPSP